MHVILLYKCNRNRKGLRPQAPRSRSSREGFLEEGVPGLGLGMWTENTAFSYFLCASIQDYKLPECRAVIPYSFLYKALKSFSNLSTLITWGIGMRLSVSSHGRDSLNS